MNDEQKGKHIFVAKFSLLTEFLKNNKGFYLTSRVCADLRVLQVILRVSAGK